MTVIGLGLIGSSVARGVKARGLARKITGYDLSPYLRARASELTFCDEIAQTPGEAVASAELVVIAVPVGATAQTVAAIAPHLAQGSIVTEVGSVKARWCLSFQRAWPSFQATRSQAPSIPVPMPASPTCSKDGGAS